MLDSERIIWTAGYGDRTLSGFVALLTDFHIESVVDIRSSPIPYRGAQFTSDQLRAELDRREIQFHRAGHQLGTCKKASPDSTHVALSKSLRGHAEHMSTPVFRQGVKQLIDLAEHNRVILVTELKDFENCHRRLVADYLALTEGLQFIHILDRHLVVEHTLTSYIRYQFNSIVYDGLGAQSIIVH